MGDLAASSALGVATSGYQRGAGTGPWDQFVCVRPDQITSYRGRAATFVTPGRAAVNQNLAAMFNASGSAVLMRINRITIDLLSTAAAGKAPSVVTPVVRIRRITAVPTNGTSVGKTAMDTQYATTATAITAWGDASADGTSSGTTLTAAITGGILAQKYAPRTLVVGTSASTFYEPVDTIPFFYGEPDVICRAGEGVLVSLEAATTSTGNPTTDRWTCEFDWDEYTRP